MSGASRRVDAVGNHWSRGRKILGHDCSYGISYCRNLLIGGRVLLVKGICRPSTTRAFFFVGRRM